MISEKHHTIFVHIPKVAGQSIETIFLKDLGLNWQSRGELLLRKKKAGEKGPNRLAHLRAAEYTQFGYTDKKTFDDYFTFSFVRNPYKRLLSAYNYLGYSKIISFVTFMKHVVSGKLEDGHFFFISQYDYLYSGEQLLVDYVGKLENLKADMQFVLEKTGLSGHEIPHVNKSEKGLKRGIAALLKSPKLWTKFTPGRIFSAKKKKELTPEEKELVYMMYPKDFEKFQYER